MYRRYRRHVVSRGTLWQSTASVEWSCLYCCSSSGFRCFCSRCLLPSTLQPLQSALRSASRSVDTRYDILLAHSFYWQPLFLDIVSIPDLFCVQQSVSCLSAACLWCMPLVVDLASA